MYQVGPRLGEQPINETISGFDHLIVEVGGVIKRVPASTLLNSNNYKGPADLNTVPDTSAIGNWYECTITGTYPNFGNQAANAYDRFYWNGATWDLYPYSQVYGLPTGTFSIGTSISSNEVKIDEYRVNQLVYDIYQMNVKLLTLPTTRGTSVIYTVANIPLGFNLFMDTELSVSPNGKDTFSNFSKTHKVVRVFVDTDLNTKVEILCTNDSPVSNGVINLRYVKDFGQTLELTVTVPATIDPANVNLTFPKLKYNKKEVASIVVDDTYSIWNNVFSLINKRWVDDELMSFFNPNDTRIFFYHKDFSYEGYTKTTGFIPTKALEYSDGTGINHRFAISVASWAWHLGTRDFIAGWGIPWVTAAEARFMADFGNTLLYHDFEDYIQGISLQGFIAAADKDAAKFLTLTDRTPKILETPNGDVAYNIYGWEYPTIQFEFSEAFRAGGGNFMFFYPFVNSVDIDDKGNQANIYRKFFNSVSYTFTDFLNEITNDIADVEANRIWRIFGMHRVDPAGGIRDFLTSLESLHGVSGDDTIWFCSPDEMVEYWFMTRYAAISKSVSGQEITFKIHVPAAKNFWFNSISCLLSGISDITGVVVSSSDNCNGTSFAINNGQLLVNLDFNKDLLGKVEKYVSIFETNSAQLYAHDDAQYFVQMLKPGVRDSYQARIDVLLAPPTLTSISINSGATTTTNTTISVSIVSTGVVTQYMISEASNFSGALWQSYTGDFQHTFATTTIESKTIYVKIQNAYGVSSVVNSSISYLGALISLDSVSINSGANSTLVAQVSVAVTYSNSTPTFYRMGETSDLSAVAWIAWAGSPINYTFSSEGTKTVYVQIKDASNESLTIGDSIIYSTTPVPANKVVISFANPANLYNSSSYEIVNSETINYICYNRYEGYADFLLKDTTGVSKGYFVVKPSELPVGTWQGFTNISSLSPVLSGDAGPYPDAYIDKYINANAPEISGNVALLRLKGFAAGNYSARILTSKNAEYNSGNLFFQINDSADLFLTKLVLNNVSNFEEITFTVVTNGFIDLKAWNTSGIYYSPGFNLIEINLL